MEDAAAEEAWAWDDSDGRAGSMQDGGAAERDLGREGEGGMRDEGGGDTEVPRGT